MNKKISQSLELIAKLLTIKGENQFKVRAFENAAKILLQVNNLDELIEKNKLLTIKGIGKSLVNVIQEIYSTGESSLLKELQQEIPEGIIEMLSIKGLGAKKVRVLFKELGIKNIGELEYACNENRLIKLKGFGIKTQNNILKSILRFKMRKKILHYPYAKEIAVEILNTIFKEGITEKIAISGEVRRKKEIISCIEFVVIPKFYENFLNFLSSVIKIKDKKEDIIKGFIEEISVLFHITDNKTFLKKLFFTTGSEKFLKEFTNFDNFFNERTFFKKANLPYIPPECREYFYDFYDTTNLLTYNALKGLFHVHTIYSDGVNTIEEIVEFLKQTGYSYVGISDHSKSAFYANGLNIDDIKRQHEEIDYLNEKHAPFKIFKGIESDILKNGSLDYPDNILELFDFVIASVHSSFNLSEKDMTDRVIQAVTNPFTTIIGHPTGRLLLYREEINLNIDKFLETVATNNKFIEINTHPYRLDLSWENCIKAKRLGIKFFINPDAHNLEGFSFVKYGVDVARKAMLKEDDIINAQPLEKIKSILLND